MELKKRTVEEVTLYFVDDVIVNKYKTIVLPDGRTIEVFCPAPFKGKGIVIFEKEDGGWLRPAISGQQFYPEGLEALGDRGCALKNDMPSKGICPFDGAQCYSLGRYDFCPKGEKENSQK
ncbi:MAG: hypothetical protein V1698_00010 [bacterium]